MKRILNKKYYNDYMKKRYQERRALGFELLGSSCVNCGEKDKSKLQFDHKKRKGKSFTIADGMLWSYERFIKEIKKCQIMCADCHKEKTIYEIGATDGRKTHGTLTSYKYCKCDLCKKAASEYNKKYRSNRKKIKI